MGDLVSDFVFLELFHTPLGVQWVHSQGCGRHKAFTVLVKPQFSLQCHAECNLLLHSWLMPSNNTKSFTSTDTMSIIDWGHNLKWNPQPCALRRLCSWILSRALDLCFLSTTSMQHQIYHYQRDEVAFDVSQPSVWISYLMLRANVTGGVVIIGKDDNIVVLFWCSQALKVGIEWSMCASPVELFIGVSDSWESSVDNKRNMTWSFLKYHRNDSV